MGAEIVFIDEVGFSFLEKTATTWAPQGETPILSRVSKRRAISTAVALTLSGRLLKCHFDHAVRGPDVIVALHHIRRYLHGPLIIVWDRLSAHKDRQVQEWIAADAQICVEWLPPYSPDLNPEEACNAHVKRQLRNATPQDVDQLKRLVDHAFAILRHKTNVIQGFFEHAGITT